MQVEAVPDLKLILALADGALTTWEAGNLRKKPAGGALDTKHALFFALNVRGPPRHKLCVVSSKKRLRLYAARVPARWAPARFDYVLASHQIFHVCVFAAAWLHYGTVLAQYSWRVRQGAEPGGGC